MSLQKIDAVAVLILSLALFPASLPRAAADESPPAAGTAERGEVDLLQRYPTKLAAGDTRPDKARSWEFTNGDIFRVKGFRLEVGKEFRIEVGAADLGVGHCEDGAVWAVVIPRAGGTLTSSAANREEAISHVWLRFHPKEIARLFPPETVYADGATDLLAQIRAIANAKFISSWHAGMNAMIPEPKDMTVDVDTKDGPRRFFGVDKEAQTARYVAALENRAVRQPPVLTPKLAEAAFDQLWDAFDQKYAMFVLRPEVDWTKLREQYRPKALASKSTHEFADVCADMLKELRDLHVWLTVAGANVPVFNRPRSANANPQAYRAILGDLKEKGGVAWAITANNIGYINIYGWSDAKIPAQCDEALEKMRNTRGLIVDVRLNGGGGEPLAQQFAGRFLEKQFVYAYSQFRNGPKHTDLTEKYERKVAPRGPWRYDRPVILLIGQKCMSSNESFIGMMSGNPQVTTMGDHTCGSSGNPEIVNLPLEMSVSVPKWIDYLPDGTPLDERGFQPQVPFKPAPGAFEGQRDDLLKAAIERLSRAPLPERPIEGPAFEQATADMPDHSRGVNEEAQDASRPKVVSVTPANDTQAVNPVSELHVRFDRPMDPLSLKLDWETGGFLDCEFPKYDADKYEFTIPMHLAPGGLQQIVVNKPSWEMGNLSKARTEFPRDGFQSADHHLASLFLWRFRTQAAAEVSKNRGKGDSPIFVDTKIGTVPKTTPPKVTNISPAPGSEAPFRTFLEIQFDQAMTPPAEAMPYMLSEPSLKEPLMIPRIEYDAARHTFRIPIMMPLNEKVAFDLTGFRSATGAMAEPIKLQYQVSEEEVTKTVREKIEAGAKEPRLLDLLESIKEKRTKLTSLAERIQSLELRQKDGLFVGLKSQSATFKWQKPDQYYGDVSDIMSMCSDFRIGSDGQNWWWHLESSSNTKFVVCPAKEIHELNISICDPFDLTQETPAAVAAKRGLNFAGTAKIGDTDCLMVEAWQIYKMPGMTPFGSLIQWYIDPGSYRTAQITHFGPGSVLRTRFLYDAVNEPLPAGDFAVPKLEGISPSPPEPLDEGYTKRCINLRDGSDGRMSLRWGKQGPGGTSSSGLN